MSRRGKKYCLPCNSWQGNGSEGVKGTEAIGIYFLPKREGAFSGQIPYCNQCKDFIENNMYFERFEEFKVKPIEITEEQKICKHNWIKDNLVGQEDGSDFWKCENCGWRFKRFIGQDLPK